MKKEPIVRFLKIWALPAIVMSVCCAAFASLTTYLVLFQILGLPVLNYDSLFNIVTYAYLFMFSGTFFIASGALKFSYLFSFSIKRAVAFETALLSLGFVRRSEQIAFAQHMKLMPYVAHRPLEGTYTQNQKGRVYASFNTRIHDLQRTNTFLEENRLFLDAQAFECASNTLQRAIDMVAGEKILTLEKHVFLLEGEVQVLRQKNQELKFETKDLRIALNAAKGQIGNMQKRDSRDTVAEEIGKAAAAMLQRDFTAQKFTSQEVQSFLKDGFELPSECVALMQQLQLSLEDVRIKAVRCTLKALPSTMKHRVGNSKKRDARNEILS